MEDQINLFIFAGIGIVLLGFGIYSLGKYMATRALGLEIAIDPKVVCRGDKVKVLMRVNPSKTVEIPEIAIKVECKRFSKEKRRGGRRGGSSTSVDIMARSETYIAGETLFAGQPKTIEAGIVIPSGGLPTDRIGNLKVKWYLTVSFQIPSGFNAEKKMEIEVVDVSRRPRRSFAQGSPAKPLVSKQPDSPDFKLCMSCGAKNNSDVKFCNECGDMLG